MRYFSLGSRLGLGLSLLFGLAVQAEPTHIVVRARSLDAKFIGDHTGGVHVTLTDATTGQVLASGDISGGTGDTARIMKTPLQRGQVLSDAKTAGFAATLDLTQPTLIRLEARGPLGKPAAAITVSSMMWVAPGHDVMGDGWVVTFPGLVVEPQLKRLADGRTAVVASVTMMCGCPISQNGVWDASDITVTAQGLGPDAKEAVILHPGSEPSTFSATLNGPIPKTAKIRVVAVQKSTPNVGVAEIQPAP